MDKLWLAHQGKLVVADLIERFQGRGTEAVVAMGHSKPIPKELKAKFVEDLIPGGGPVAGLHAGLVHIPSPWALVLACDMPFVSRKLVDLLLAQAQKTGLTTVCEIGGFLEPFPGVYSRALLSVLEQAVREKLGVQRFLRSVPHAVIPEVEVRQADPQLRSFVNINAREDHLRWLKEAG